MICDYTFKRHNPEERHQSVRSIVRDVTEDRDFIGEVTFDEEADEVKFSVIEYDDENDTFRSIEFSDSFTDIRDMYAEEFQSFFEEMVNIFEEMLKKYKQ